MATKQTTTTHVVLLTLNDIKPIIQANLRNVDLNIVEVRPPTIADGRKGELVIPLSQSVIDLMLRAIVPELPQTYKVENLFGDGNLVAKITWND